MCEQALTQQWKVKGRIINQMRAGIKKPEGAEKRKSQGNSDERDRTDFIILSCQLF